jgi:hypothetical protein
MDSRNPTKLHFLDYQRIGQGHAHRNRHDSHLSQRQLINCAGTDLTKIKRRSFP